MTRGSQKLYITFINDYSRYTRVYLLRNKDEAMDAFIKYKNEVKNQLSKKIKRLRFDKGGEYESNPFNTFCEEHEIIYETTPPYSLESYGVAKRKNRTLKEMMNVMLVSSRVMQGRCGPTPLATRYYLGSFYDQVRMGKVKTP